MTRVKHHPSQRITFLCTILPSNRRNRTRFVSKFDVGGPAERQDILEHDIDQEAERIADRRKVLFSLDFLARVISSRINLCPPFSALFTLWLSTIASVGVSDLPSNTRTSAWSA